MLALHFVSMQKDFPGVVYDTDVHFFGMQVDSAIKFVLFGVKSHMASSFGLKFFVYKTTLSYFETFILGNKNSVL